MAQDLPIDPTLPRVARMHQLIPALDGLLTGESSGVANLANVAAALWSATGWHWVGFYLVDQAADSLVLGPFQGPVACTRLHRGKGVCAAAWATQTTQVVPDVHAFPGHVACSSASLSEVVLPICAADGGVVAVLDIDSAAADDFSREEVEGLEALRALVERAWPTWSWS